MVVEGMVAVVCVCACEQLGWLLHQARLVGLRRAGVVQGVRRRAVVRMRIPSGLSPHTSTRASGSRLRHTQFCWPRRYGIGLGFLCHAKVARRKTRAKGRGLTARSEGRMDGGGLWDGTFPPSHFCKCRGRTRCRPFSNTTQSRPLHPARTAANTPTQARTQDVAKQQQACARCGALRAHCACGDRRVRGRAQDAPQAQALLQAHAACCMRNDVRYR